MCFSTTHMQLLLHLQALLICFQDAHELFHVLTETLDEESTKYPSVISLLDIVQLLVRLSVIVSI